MQAATTDRNVKKEQIQQKYLKNSISGLQIWIEKLGKVSTMKLQ